MRISAPNPGERVADVSFDNGSLCVSLRDGRKISAPLVWFPRLLHATPEQRNNWEIAGAGYGIHWPDLDEDLSTEGLCAVHALRSKRAKHKMPPFRPPEPPA